MTKPRPHADLIKAWADGAEIESKYGDGRWHRCESPMWVDGGEYRIKREPKPDIVTECKILGVYRAILWNSTTNTVPNANLRLTFDGETGKLKSAEVI